jgi:Zn-dependent protease with chaperone function
MTAILRFVIYNLLVSLAGGILAWLIVIAVMRILRIRSSSLSLCFLALPLFKSMLLLVGVGLVFPWPGQLFEKWHKLALPFSQVWPFFLLWAGGAYLVYRLIIGRARQAVLRGARPASEAAPSLAAAFDAVLRVYQQLSCPKCSDDLCGVSKQRPHPRLLVSDRIDSPLALTDGGEPAVIFPVGLISRLNSAELAGALAHELAHFVLRRPDWCSVGTLQKLILVDPAASLVGEYLHRQEEKACDDLAVTITGQPEVYADMLTKGYRFSNEHSREMVISRFHALPRLLGFRPLLSDRIEHLLDQESSAGGIVQSPVIISLVWVGLMSVLFFSWSA